MTVSLLIFLPVIAALAVLFFKNEAVKHVALFFGVAELALSLYFLSCYHPDASVQFAVNAPWMPKLGIYFNAGIDGLSMVMIILTTLLRPSKSLPMLQPAALYMMHEHINYFTERSLTTLMRMAGGVPIASGTYPMVTAGQRVDMGWCLGTKGVA